MFPLSPYFSSLCNSFPCGTVSNALEKSNMTILVWSPLSLFLRISCFVVRSCVSQEYLALNLWFKFVRIVIFSK